MAEQEESGPISLRGRGRRYGGAPMLIVVYLKLEHGRKGEDAHLVHLMSANPTRVSYQTWGSSAH